MKANILVAATALLMGSGLALAAGQSQENEAHHPGSAPASAPGTPAMAGGCMPMMQEHMQKMRAQMAEIHRTRDPDKRDKLIQAHMDSMNEMMNKMRDMHRGKPMMGGPKGGMMGGSRDGMTGGPGMMGGPKDGMTGGPGMMGGPRDGVMGGPGMMGGSRDGMMNRQKMMEQRMNMMQMMMDQMMQHQAATEKTRRQRHEHSKMK